MKSQLRKSTVLWLIINKCQSSGRKSRLPIITDVNEFGTFMEQSHCLNFLMVITAFRKHVEGMSSVANLGYIGLLLLGI